MIQAEAVVECNCPKLLIVDDNVSVLFVLQSYLGSVRISADEAMNGQDALNKLIERSMKDCCGNYRLIIMDVDMPLMNGVEATKFIRNRIDLGELPDVPVLALTATRLTIDQEELFFKEIGFAGHMSKPIGRSEFLDALKIYGIGI